MGKGYVDSQSSDFRKGIDSEGIQLKKFTM